MHARGRLSQPSAPPQSSAVAPNWSNWSSALQGQQKQKSPKAFSIIPMLDKLVSHFRFLASEPRRWLFARASSLLASAPAPWLAASKPPACLINLTRSRQT